MNHSMNNNNKQQGSAHRAQRSDINSKQENTSESQTERRQTTAYKLVSHPAHDSKGKATVDPGMGLPLSDTGMDAVSTTHAIEELLGCRAIRAEHRETRRLEIEAVTGTCQHVFVSLRLRKCSQCRGSISLAPPPPPGRGVTDKVHASVMIARQPYGRMSAGRVSPQSRWDSRP